MSTCYLNGEFKPVAEATVSVMDRGFLFGDGVYEVVPVYGRKAFRLAEHLQRLQNSLDGIRLSNPHTRDEWARIIERVIAAYPADDQQVYLQVTRGVAAIRNHAFPSEVRPGVLVMTDALTTPNPEMRQQGVSAISTADIRWLRCDLKSTSLLANCLLRQMAVDAGCAETVLFRDGILTEGAAANIFVVKDNVLLAPQKNHLMLPGVTYDVVLEIAALHRISVVVRDISDAEVRNADELLLTSSTREVLPIVSLDDKPIGNGKPGPLTLQLASWYEDFKRTVMHGAK